MKKRVILIFMLIAISLLAWGIVLGVQKYQVPQEVEQTTQKFEQTTKEPKQVSQEREQLFEEPEYAYLTLVKELSKPSEEDKYLAVDLSGVVLKDTSKLEKLLKEYCDERGIELLLENMSGLKEKGYTVVSNYPMFLFMFVDGLQWIGFEDSRLEKHLLVANVGLYTNGWRYTLRYQPITDSWEIINSEPTWIV